MEYLMNERILWGVNALNLPYILFGEQMFIFIEHYPHYLTPNFPNIQNYFSFVKFPGNFPLRSM